MTELRAQKAQTIQQFLTSKGLDAEVKELSTSTHTAQEAATSVGCDVAQIAKSLIFRTKSTQKPVLILASGANRVSESIIESHVGEKITKADATFTRDVTGFAIGGIPPFGHKDPIHFIFIDEDLLNFEEVWAAAGTPFSLFKLKTKDLVTISQGKVISIYG